MDSDGVWAVMLADYIRANDTFLLESTDKLLAMFEEEVLPCESFHEFCDVLGTSPVAVGAFRTGSSHV